MKNKSLTLGNTVLLSLILIANLFFLFYLKYSNHNLSFSDFSIYKIGNLINAAFAFLIILGLFILFFQKTNIPQSTIYLLTGLINLFLLMGVIINFLNIPRREYYLLSLSFTQVLIIIAFSLFQFTQLFFLLIIWLKILKIEKLIYLRAMVNSIFITMGLLIFTLFFINTKSISPINTTFGHDKPSIAVVLGAAVWSDNKPSPSLAFRVDKAAELYDNGIVNKIQLTGGNAPGELSEAEVSLNHILKKGIKRDDIWIEKNTTSTIEQVKFIKKELIQKKQFQSVVIVSDIYHLQRVKEICKFYNVKAEVAASDLNLKTDKIIFYQLRECMALILFWLFAL
jgi:vancomycin permeability regulator SanA